MKERISREQMYVLMDNEIKYLYVNKTRVTGFLGVNEYLHYHVELEDGNIKYINKEDMEELASKSLTDLINKVMTRTCNNINNYTELLNKEFDVLATLGLCEKRIKNEY